MLDEYGVSQNESIGVLTHITPIILLKRSFVTLGGVNNLMCHIYNLHSSSFWVLPIVTFGNLWHAWDIVATWDRDGSRVTRDVGDMTWVINWMT